MIKMFDYKDKLLRRSLDSLGWMIEDIKAHHEMDDPKMYGQEEITYSPELTRAMKLRDDLEKYFKQGSEDVEK